MKKTIIRPVCFFCICSIILAGFCENGCIAAKDPYSWKEAAIEVIYNAPDYFGELPGGPRGGFQLIDLTGDGAPEILNLSYGGTGGWFYNGNTFVYWDGSQYKAGTVDEKLSHVCGDKIEPFRNSSTGEIGFFLGALPASSRNEYGYEDYEIGHNYTALSQVLCADGLISVTQLHDRDLEGSGIRYSGLSDAERRPAWQELLRIEQPFMDIYSKASEVRSLFDETYVSTEASGKDYHEWVDESEAMDIVERYIDSGTLDTYQVASTPFDLENSRSFADENLSGVTKNISYSIKKVEGETTFSFKPIQFTNVSESFNIDIARFAANFIMLGYSGHDTVVGALESFGFHASDFKMGQEMVSSVELDTSRDQVNNFIAHYIPPDESFCLLFVGMVGSNKMQWNSNFDPNGTEREDHKGKAGPLKETHGGFSDAKEYVQKRFESYIKYNRLDSKYGKDKLKILVAGHSRGAAAANLFAADLLRGADGKKDAMNYAKADNIFAYTFATPNSTIKKNTQNNIYARIYNIINPEDFVTYVLPSDWGYGRFGTDIVLPSSSNSASSFAYLGLKSNMQTVFGKLRKDKEYHPYALGTKATIDVVNAFTSVFSKKEFYKLTRLESKIKTGSVAPFYFFRDVLCPTVNETTDINNTTLVQCLLPNLACFALPSVVSEVSQTITYYSNPYARLLAYFVGNEVANSIFDLCAERIKQTNHNFNNAVLNYSAKDQTDETLVKIIADDLSDVIVDSFRSDLSQGYFSDSHRMETYCAWVMSLDVDSIMSAQRMSYYKLHCPVDVEIYEKNSGDVVARVVNNEIDEAVSEKENSIRIEVVGDSKEFILPENDNYEAVITGNDNGVMNCSVDSYGLSGELSNRVYYKNVSVQDGKQMYFSDNFIVDDAGNTLSVGETLLIEDAEKGTVSISIEGNGLAFGGGNYYIGDNVVLSSVANEDEEFLGWYEGENNISTDPVCEYIVNGNVQIIAKFSTNTGPATNMDPYKGLNLESNVLRIIICFVAVWLLFALLVAVIYTVKKKKQGKLKMKCPNCGNFLNDNAAFCRYCGAKSDGAISPNRNGGRSQNVGGRRVDYNQYMVNSMDGDNHRNPDGNRRTKIIIIIACVVFSFSAIVAIIFFVSQKKPSLTDGFWMAPLYMNNTDEYDLDNITNGYDLGFIFKEEKTEQFDGLVITNRLLTWRYKINKDEQVEIYRIKDTGEQILMFNCMYNKDDDSMTVYSTNEAGDYYDSMEDHFKIRLTHIRDHSAKNSELMKKLYFEVWTTLDNKDYFGVKGFNTFREYSDMRTSLYTVDPNVELFKFYFNEYEFDMSDGNAQQLRSEDGESWHYSAFTYSLAEEPNTLTRYSDNTMYSMYYDKEYSFITLQNETETKILYRLTNISD